GWGAGGGRGRAVRLPRHRPAVVSGAVPLGGDSLGAEGGPGGVVRGGPDGGGRGGDGHADGEHRRHVPEHGPDRAVRVPGGGRGAAGGGGAGAAQAPAAAITAFTRSALTGEISPRSVRMARMSAAGVTSKAGLRAVVRGGQVRSSPQSVTSAGARSSMGMARPSGQARSKVEAGAATRKGRRW